MGRLDGKSVIVTGSSRGIGAGIAAKFAAEGANVVVNSRSLERARSTAEAITDDGGTAVAVEADAGDRDDVRELVDAAVDEFGRLDVMVNNAGLFSSTPAVSLTAEEWTRVVDVNLSGVFYGVQAAGERMIEQGDGGQIISVSSIFGSVGVQGRAAYNATKAGVENLTRGLGVEFAEHDVHVNALAPGFIRTETDESASDESEGPDSGGADEGGTSEAAPDERRGAPEWPKYEFEDRDIRNRTPLGRFGTVEEIANCALFLAAGDHYMTGEVLHADGGWLAFGWGSKGL